MYATTNQIKPTQLTEMTTHAESATRRETPTVEIDQVRVGSRHPIVVQSMTNTDTEDAKATAQQVAELARAGSELVRITVSFGSFLPRIAGNKLVPASGVKGVPCWCVG